MSLLKTLPALKASLAMGHLGTYYDKQGGAAGMAAVAYFNWLLKGDMAAKALFFDKNSTLVALGWNIRSRNME